MNAPKPDLGADASVTLDPEDWPATRATAHLMLDNMLDYIEHIRDRPVWTEPPGDIARGFREPLPRAGRDLAEVHQRFLTDVLPYATGNVHPRFMGWVHGAGNVAGALGEMLAAGLNANLGGRNHMPIQVERQIALWSAEMLGFPDTASGLFVTGTSMANFVALLVARTARLGRAVRTSGLGGEGLRLTAYASRAAHGCVQQALELAGLGADALRLIETDAAGKLDLTALELSIAADREAGFQPFFVTGTAGSVDTGAVDDLAALADLSARNRLWFHVDGAFGALAALAPDLRHLLDGIERADSVAFDFHKWGQVPYDAGFVLVRDADAHRAAFASDVVYLRRYEKGIAGGEFWPCDYGPDLSRGFRALKTWFTLQVHGADRIGATISKSCALARHLAALVEAEPDLEMHAPVTLNVACFGFRGPDADLRNRRVVQRLHELGVAAPSTTVIEGHTVIRAALVNHRTTKDDVAELVRAVIELGREPAE